MSGSLSGSTVLVVGGATHLGLAIARRADADGAAVIIGARSLTAAHDAAADLRDARAVRLDVTDEQSIAAAAEHVGQVDHIVSTTAAHHNVAVTELDHDATVTAFETKVIGPLMLVKHFAPTMPPTGSIVLFSGVAAWKPEPGYAVMGITNGAVAFTVSQLARELAPIRVNAVSPGIVDSGTWDQLPVEERDEFFASVASGIPAGRVGTPSDIADAVRWLLTAPFVSGETIHVEGGARS